MPLSNVIHGSCREAHRLLSRRLDAPLSLPEQTRLWIHLRVCGSCCQVEQQFGLLREAMRRLGT